MAFDAAAKEDYSGCDCLAIAILTHGGANGMLHGVDHDPNRPTKENSGSISVDHLLEPLKKCEGLFGKPKLVFIQVCF